MGTFFSHLVVTKLGLRQLDVQIKSGANFKVIIGNKMPISSPNHTEYDVGLYFNMVCLYKKKGFVHFNELFFFSLKWVQPILLTVGSLPPFSSEEIAFYYIA